MCLLVAVQVSRFEKLLQHSASRCRRRKRAYFEPALYCGESFRQNSRAGLLPLDRRSISVRKDSRNDGKPERSGASRGPAVLSVCPGFSHTVPDFALICLIFRRLRDARDFEAAL
jgi:hypothetical protein